MSNSTIDAPLFERATVEDPTIAHLIRGETGSPNDRALCGVRRANLTITPFDIPREDKTTLSRACSDCHKNL